jgi:hypothetical protein
MSAGKGNSNIVHVSFWHKCELPTALRKVRFQGQAGRHLLALSSSQFDPNRTSAESCASFHFHQELVRPATNATIFSETEIMR